MFRDLLHNILNRHGYINCKRVYWFFEHVKLTLEHLWLHIMILAGRYPRPDQIITAFEIYDQYIVVTFKQPLTVTLLECGASQHAGSIQRQTGRNQIVKHSKPSVAI